MNCTRIELSRRNIANLTALWTCMGVTDADAPVRASNTWPHRVWLPWDAEATPRSAERLVAAASDGNRPSEVVVAVWPWLDDPLLVELSASGLVVRFALTAMVLAQPFETPPAPTELVLERVRAPEVADHWTRVASTSFGYVVDATVPRRLLQVEAAELYFVRRDGAAVGTALLFVDESAVGIHMMGVLPTARRQGIARGVMRALLRRAAAWPDRPVTLQASAAGRPLYASLGFEPQFDIPHLGRPAS